MPAKNAHICTICQVDLTKRREIVTLTCGGSHTFCYGCIYDWYLSIRSGTTSYQPHSCPMCFQDGGLLPLREGYEKIYLVNSPHKCHDGSSSMTVDRIHMFYNSCKCVDPLTGDYCKRGGIEEVRPVNKGYSIFLCGHHYADFRKGVDVNHRCLGFLESPYQKVPCACQGCDKQVIKKFAIIQGEQDRSQRFVLCNEHRKVVRGGGSIRLRSGGKLRLPDPKESDRFVTGSSP